MDIKDQLQIIEDNLNEYGQCNITLEEFNYLKKQIRADAIDEMVIALGVEPFSAYVMEIVRHKAKKLKEQNRS